MDLISTLDAQNTAAEAAATVAEPAVAPRRTLTDVGCRILDVAVAVPALIVLSPLMALLALLVRLESRGPAIFRQERVGHHQRPFTINKFRTMRRDAGHEVHQTFVLRLISGETPAEGFKMDGDLRITRVGRLLRKSSLDELPQLWNVVRGDMSLVGPRPPIHYEVDHYPPHWFGRFDVKPGITGLWQVSGRSRVTLEEMVAQDLQYARERSVWLNVRILVLTLPAVLRAQGAA